MRKAGKVLLVVLGVVALGLSGFAGDQDGVAELLWVTITSETNLPQLRASIESQGGKILTLAPEDALLVRIPKDKSLGLKALDGTGEIKAFTRPSQEPASAGGDDGKGLGARRLTAEERAYIDQRVKPMGQVVPNQLSSQRAQLEGTEVLQPSQADNSPSIYFPPIRTQGSQNSCAPWACGYYFNTYTQALDENLDVSGGDNRYICSPSFLYPLENEGLDDGSSPFFLMLRLNEIGCACWDVMPYDVGDYTTWPSETAWVDGLKRRTHSTYRIGNQWAGCSDSDLNTIKLHLSNGGLAVTATEVYANMYYDYPANTSGINNEVLFATSGAYVSGHAMTLVGYDDNKSYYDGSQTRYGAFLLANSWGTDWGTYNSASTSKGFMWVGYEFFKADNFCFGEALLNLDLDDYRPFLYVASGLNHAQRGRIWYEAGVGSPSSPDWISAAPLMYSGGNTLSIDDSERVVVDLTDGLPSVPDLNNIALYAELYVSPSASSNGTMTSAYFYEDFDMNDAFRMVPSTDPPLTATPGNSAYATVNIQPASAPTSVGVDWHVYR